MKERSIPARNAIRRPKLRENARNTPGLRPTSIFLPVPVNTSQCSAKSDKLARNERKGIMQLISKPMRKIGL